MSNNDQCENLPNVVPTTIYVINGTNILRNVPRVEAFHIESDSNGSLHLFCFIWFTIFNSINISEDHDIGLSDESINSTDIWIFQDGFLKWVLQFHIPKRVQMVFTL